MWMALSKFGPKHPASGTCFPHTTALRTGDYQGPSQVLTDLRKWWSYFCSTLDITATDPEWPMPTQLCLATTWTWTGVYTPTRVNGFPLSLSRPEAVAGLSSSTSKWYVPGVLQVWSGAQQHQYHVGTCEKYKFSGPSPELLNQILQGGGCPEICDFMSSPCHSDAAEVWEPVY